MSQAQHYPYPVISDDPLNAMGRIRTRLNSVWLKRTYPFAEFGEGVSIHHSCAINKMDSPEIAFGDNVYLAPGVTLETSARVHHGQKIFLGSGCQIGRGATISARRQVILEANVLLAPEVLIADHDGDFFLPDDAHGAENDGARVTIERNCWLGYGAVIVSAGGDIVIGHNSVVGAKAVVTISFPPCSVVAGNPAKLIKTYDSDAREWIKPTPTRKARAI